MILQDLINAARELLDDTIGPYLWADERLYRYANNAMIEVALRTRCLKESGTPATTFPVVAGTATFAIDPATIIVSKAQMAGQKHPLILTTAKDLDRRLPGWDTDMVPAGVPEYVVFDLAQHRVTLVPTPAEDSTLYLRVCRVPNEDEKMEGPDDEPPFTSFRPEEVKHWIAHEAYLERDSERYNPERSAQHEAIFTARFGARPSQHDLEVWGTRRIVGTRPHFF